MPFSFARGRSGRGTYGVLLVPADLRKQLSSCISRRWLSSSSSVPVLLKRHSLLPSRTPQDFLGRVTGSDIVSFLYDRSEAPCLIHVQSVYVFSEIQMGSLLTAVSARLPGERLESWSFWEDATAFLGVVYLFLFLAFSFVQWPAVTTGIISGVEQQPEVKAPSLWFWVKLCWFIQMLSSPWRCHLHA